MQNARPTVAKTNTKTTVNTTKKENDLALVGAIWQNTSKNGGIYFTLKVNEGKTITSLDKVLIFNNNDKEGEKSPDLYVFVKTPI